MQAKPIEECPAATPDGSTPACAWAKAQTSITAKLQLQVPLYPPWQPPPLPAVTLQQLIPKREFVTKEDQPTASQAFQSQVQAAAKQLAIDYHKVIVHPRMLFLIMHAALYCLYSCICSCGTVLTVPEHMVQTTLIHFGCLLPCDEQASEVHG